MNEIIRIYSVQLGLTWVILNKRKMHFFQIPLVLALAHGLSAALTYKGVDWSSVKVEEQAGYTYKTTSGTTEPLETILKASGVNTVRFVYSWSSYSSLLLSDMSNT